MIFNSNGGTDKSKGLTATANDIVKDKTALVDGEVITGTKEIMEEIEITNGSLPISIDSSGMLTIPIANVQRIVGFSLYIESDDYMVQFGKQPSSSWIKSVMYCPSDDIGSNGSVPMSITNEAIVLDCSGGRIGQYMIGSTIYVEGYIIVVRN